eukprot:3008039-Pyramimonas_sp.AAC.1
MEEAARRFWTSSSRGFVIRCHMIPMALLTGPTVFFSSGMDIDSKGGAFLSDNDGISAANANALDKSLGSRASKS